MCVIYGNRLKNEARRKEEVRELSNFFYFIHLPGWWWYVVAALGSLALIIILVAVITCKRAKGGNIHRWNLDRKLFKMQHIFRSASWALTLCLCVCVTRRQETAGRKHGEFIEERWIVGTILTLTLSYNKVTIIFNGLSGPVLLFLTNWRLFFEFFLIFKMR